MILTSGHDPAPDVPGSSVPRAVRLDKPYPPEALLRAVRDALDRA